MDAKGLPTELRPRNKLQIVDFLIADCNWRTPAVEKNTVCERWFASLSSIEIRIELCRDCLDPSGMGWLS